ncbi:MAG: ABC transporter permease [Rhodospirillales bacterium]
MTNQSIAAALPRAEPRRHWNRHRIAAGKLALGVVLVGLWQLGSVSLGRDFVAPPIAVLERLWTLGLGAELWHHTAITLWEAAAGFALGGGLGVALPFLLRRSPRLTAALDPFVTVAMGVPKLALAPLLILWFGIGIFSKIVFVAALVFFLLFFNTLAGVRSVSPPLVATARVMGAGEWTVAREIVWNTTLPYIFAGIKIALPRALSAAVVGEFIAANAGLGYYINNARAMADSTGIFAGIIVVTALVIVVNAALQRVQARSTAWRPVSRDMVV